MNDLLKKMNLQNEERIKKLNEIGEKIKLYESILKKGCYSVKSLKFDCLFLSWIDQRIMLSEHEPSSGGIYAWKPLIESPGGYRLRMGPYLDKFLESFLEVDGEHND